jgi:hypothetical protein
LIIFDYDDTIFPTSYLNRKGLKLTDTEPLENSVKSVLNTYSNTVNKTLSLARCLGHVLIVTNAEDRWISLTIEKFMPNCIVESFQHISARSIFEPTGIVCPIEWKESAFKMVVEEYLAAGGDISRSKGQVISLGDSAHEREAVLKISQEFPVVVKSLKLMERPELESLTRQHVLIQECLKEIVKHDGCLDLCIQPGATSGDNGPVAGQADLDATDVTDPAGKEVRKSTV